MLTSDPPNLDGAREAVRRTMRDGNRASDVIARLRALFNKQEPASESVDLNEAAREVIALSLGELQNSRVIVRTELADDLQLVTADRVQLQQVVLNLLRNALDAMNTVDDCPRDLLIRTEREEGDWVRLSVKDTGDGFDPQTTDKLFEPFYSTKNDGMGVGLSVSRSIIENHQGRIWAVGNDGPGATFSFSVPCRPIRSSKGERVTTSGQLEIRQVHRHKHSVRCERPVRVPHEDPSSRWKPQALHFDVVGDEMRGARPAGDVDLIVVPPQKSLIVEVNCCVGQCVCMPAENSARRPLSVVHQG